MKRFDFCASPHKRGESSGNCGLEASADRTGTRELIDLHRVCHALDRNGPHRVDLDDSFHQAEGVNRQTNTARRSQLLHTRRQVRGRSHGGIVHVRVVADSAYHPPEFRPTLIRISMPCVRRTCSV